MGEIFTYVPCPHLLVWKQEGSADGILEVNCILVGQRFLLVASIGPGRHVGAGILRSIRSRRRWFFRIIVIDSCVSVRLHCDCSVFSVSSSALLVGRDGEEGAVNYHQPLCEVLSWQLSSCMHTCMQVALHDRYRRAHWYRFGSAESAGAYGGAFNPD